MHSVRSLPAIFAALRDIAVSGELIAGNRMDSNNLATLFAPNILHSSNTNPQDQMTAQASEERIDVINVIRAMIDHNKALFQVLELTIIAPALTYFFLRFLLNFWTMFMSICWIRILRLWISC